MEILKVKVFTGDSNCIEDEKNKPINSINKTKDEYFEQEFRTAKIKDVCTSTSELLLDLPKYIKADKVGYVNKFLTKRPPEVIDLDKSFYIDYSYFDYSKTDKELRRYISYLYYRIIAVNIIMEMKDFITGRDRVMFELIEDNIPSFLSTEYLVDCISYLLRSKGINTIDSMYEENPHIIVENHNSGEAKYLLKVLSKNTKIDIDVFRLSLVDVTDKLDSSIFMTLYLTSISKRTEVIKFNENINKSCDLINSDEFMYDILKRIEQLYNTSYIMISSMCEFSDIKIKEIDDRIKSRTVDNIVKNAWDSCITSGYRLESFENMCNWFTDILINTNRFSIYSEDIDLQSYCSSITDEVSRLYKDILSMFYYNGNVNTCLVKEGEEFWL